jgi:hypothetical protein
MTFAIFPLVALVLIIGISTQYVYSRRQRMVSSAEAVLQISSLSP